MQPIDSSLKTKWIDLLSHDGDARLHPDWILGNSQVPIIYADHDATNLLSLAVLQPERLRPFRVGPQLHGYHLAYNRMIGDTGPEACAKFGSTLLDYVNADAIDYVRMDDMEYGGPLWNALKTSGAAFYASNPLQRWWTDLAASKQYFAKIKKSFGQKARKLQRLGSEFRTYTDVSDLTTAISTIYPNTWQYRRHGIAGSSYLCEPELWRFVADLGAMRTYVLWLFGKPLAYIVGTQYGGRLSVIDIGYDSTQPQLGPGIVLTYFMLEELIANNTPNLIDWGYGDYDYKRVFSTRCTSSTQVMLIAGRGYSRLCMGLYYTGLTTKHQVSLFLKRLGIFNRVKALYHRIPKLAKHA